MEIGTLVICKQDVKSLDLRTLLFALTGGKVPLKNQYYIVEHSEPCDCGLHDCIKLDGVPTVWDERMFEPVQGAGEVNLNIDEILKP